MSSKSMEWIQMYKINTWPVTVNLFHGIQIAYDMTGHCFWSKACIMEFVIDKTYTLASLLARDKISALEDQTKLNVH